MNSHTNYDVTSGGSRAELHGHAEGFHVSLSTEASPCIAGLSARLSLSAHAHTVSSAVTEEEDPET